jgi:uncharacterized protein (DUF1330 family)
MAVYVIIDIKVIDRDLYAQYVQKVPPVVKKFGGRYLARGGKITTITGNWNPERMIILEFDNVEQVDDWLNSKEYAAMAHLRENSTVSNVIMIETGNLP